MKIIRAYIRLVETLLTGRRTEQEIRRYGICRACPHRKWVFCGLCGCVIRAKASADYPLGSDGLSIGGCPDDPPRW